MAMLTDATARCIGEAPIVSGNSADKELDAGFGNDYFGASCYRPVGDARSMDASASSSHSHRW
jgi:hypothetical protein